MVAAAALALGGCSAGVDDGYGAEVACEEFVKDRLKAPGTADFDTEFTGAEGRYTVTGSVDAENSFGAKLRSEFTCVVEHEEGDAWRLVNLTGL